MFVLAQLMCAGVGLPTIQGSDKSLWVCRGDSYGGQVCLLNVEETKKPNLVSSITVCNSEIRCIAMVPCGIHVNACNSSSSPHLSSDGVVQNRSEVGGDGSDTGGEGPDTGGEGPDTIGEGLGTGGDGLEAGGEGEGPSSPQIEQTLHKSLFRDFGSQESSSTLTSCQLDVGAPCSPILQRGTTSHLALHEVHHTEELHVSSCPLTDPHEGQCGRSTKEPSASRQNRFEALPSHREESDKDPEGGDDDVLSPVEGTCVTVTTWDSAGEERHRRDTWEGLQGTDSVPPVARGRSQSAPPDPLEVIKAELKGKSVTICESREEISVQRERPRRSNTVPMRSHNHLSENGGHPFSPLTLKPVDQSAQVWLGTGEGR